jgi:putative ABC transport system permease protein
MNIVQSFFEALESLASNKMRSGLTILGIVIGVAAVIAMVSVGRGAQNTITGSIQGIGTNLLFVFRGGSEDVRNPKPITLGDADAIADPFQAPSVANVAPVLQGEATVSYAGENHSTTLVGITPAYDPVRNMKVSEGEFIREEHLLGQASVVILRTDVADKLLGAPRSGGETYALMGSPSG